MQQSELEWQMALLRYHIKQKRADYQELQAWRAGTEELERVRCAIANLESELEFLKNHQGDELWRYHLA